LRAQPEAVGELELQLGVAAHAELVDRAQLASAEARVRKVDHAQQRERQREDHAVGDFLALRHIAQKGQSIAPVRPARKPDQTAARRDLSVDRGGQPGHELIVAAADVEALIRFLIG